MSIFRQAGIFAEQSTADGDAAALGVYLTTMDPDNTGTQNATALEADIAAAAGQQIQVHEPGEYRLNAVSASSTNINIRWMPGTTMIPDEAGGLYLDGIMLHFTNCNTKLWDIYVDGRNNGSPVMVRQDGGTFYAYAPKMIDVGKTSGDPTVLGVYGIVLKGVTTGRITEWYGDNFNDTPNGVYGDQPGFVKHILTYNCDHVVIDKGHFSSGTTGDDQDFIHTYDDGTLPHKNTGSIVNCDFRYKEIQRRCLKFQGGNWAVSACDFRRHDDFAAYDGTTDIGFNTLNCIDWASPSIPGSLSIDNCYIDATGYQTGIAASGGAPVIGDSCFLIGSIKDINRVVQTGSGLNTTGGCIGVYIDATDTGSGMRNSKIIGFARSATPQGKENFFINNVFDDPRDYWMDAGTGTQKNGFQLIGNKVVTRTAGYLAATRTSIIRNFANLQIAGNTLLEAGNTTHANRFIEITDAAATGFCIANLTHTPGLATTPVVAFSSPGVVIQLNNGVCALPALTGDVTLSAGGTATTIANNAVTLAKMATVATATFLGRTTAGTGNVEALTVTQATALLNVFGADSGSGGVKGLVPATVAGDAVKFLRGDGLWATPAGAGNVTGAASSTDNALVRFDGASGTTLQNSAVIIDDSNNVSGIVALGSGAHTITSSGSSALAVGVGGASNPALQVDASTASSVTGVKITSAASGAGVTIAAISSNGTETLNLGSKSTGGLNLQINAQTKVAVGASTLGMSNWTASSTAASVRFAWTGAADTGMTAGTESPSWYINLGQTRQHASNTLIGLQRDIRLTGSTHSFATSGGVITEAATLAIDGPPIGGTNATLTRSSALLIPTLALSNVTDGYSLNITAPSGATRNWAGIISGQLVRAGTADGIAAGTGAGTSPTIGIAGVPGNGRITLTTGTSSPGSNATIATITYPNAFPTGSFVVLTPGNAAAAALSGTTQVFGAGSTANFLLKTGSAALTDATQYIWDYHVIGY